MTAQDLKQGQTAAKQTADVQVPQPPAAESAEEQAAIPPVDMMIPEPFPADADIAEPQDVQPVEFQPLDAATKPQAGENLDLLLDVTVALSVELGTAEIPLSEILGLGPNSVIKLDRAVGEPVDILINRELVGRGEVVVVEDHLGVRVTELLRSPASSKSGSER